MAFSAIIKPQDYFSTKLYDGNGSTNAQTGVGFKPDWTWIKTRSHDGYNHVAVDVIRGVTKEIRPNTNSAEITTTNSFTSFDSDGFTLGADSTDNYNKNGNNYVAWNWKAGGTGSANSDGSVSSTVSANTTSGFSVVKYTNPGSGSPFTVGHGLGAVPKMIMIKNITGSAQNWGVYHIGPGFGKYLQLNTTIDEATANLVTATSTTTFSTYYDHHTTGVDLIAYCFAEVKGFSKIGSYYGNGNANGPFVYTGFKPAFVLFKEYTGPGSSNWTIQDDKREGYNPNNSRLFPNDSGAENASSFRIDMLSNGFKLNNSDSDSNRNGNNFLYLAFAEHPFTANVDGGLPTTAR